jgi:hypothetical protein
LSRLCPDQNFTQKGKVYLFALIIYLLKNCLFHVVSLRVQFLVPLLFLIYINDFSSCSKILDFHLFADDANLFDKDNNSNFQTDLNNELDKVYEWLCVNKLSLNVSKSNFVIFHSRQRTIKNNLPVFINNEQLKQKQSIKHLGEMIDSNLRWKSHINYTVMHKSKKKYWYHFKTSSLCKSIFTLKNFVLCSNLSFSVIWNSGMGKYILDYSPAIGCFTKKSSAYYN